MRSRRRRGRSHRSRSRRLRNKFAALVLTLLGIAAAIVLWPEGFFPDGHTYGTTRQLHLDAIRPVYPYSVLPGGAYDADELRSKLASDPIAARHYQSFDLKHVTPITLRSARLAYVSYRKGSQIYWTSKPVHLQQGETLLTDGKSLARARCGNRISDRPQEPTAAGPDLEPPEAALDIPEQWAPRLEPLIALSEAAHQPDVIADENNPFVELFGRLESEEKPTAGSESFSNPPGPAALGGFLGLLVRGRKNSDQKPPTDVVFDPGDPGDPQNPSDPSTAPVPEPDALGLILTAVVFLVGTRWLRRHRLTR